MLVAHIDGGARGNPGPAAIGVVITAEQGEVLYEEGQTIGQATNNEAEYRALIRLLEVAATDPRIRDLKPELMQVRSDSLLLVNQVTHRWKIKEPRLRELFQQVQTARSRIPFELRIKHVPRESNQEADRLVNAALDSPNQRCSDEHASM